MGAVEVMRLAFREDPDIICKPTEGMPMMRFIGKPLWLPT
jgi:hypothetical protein